MVVKQNMSRGQLCGRVWEVGEHRALWEEQNNRDGSLLEGCSVLYFIGKSSVSDVVYLTAGYLRKVARGLT